MSSIVGDMPVTDATRSKPVATWSLVLVTSLLCFLLQRGVGVSPQEWVDQLGLFPRQAWDLSNAYRFVSYGLIHVETMHWLINVLTIALFGSWFERKTSPRALLGVFVFGVVGAGATHVIIYPESLLPLMGASGGVSALVGAAIMRGQPYKALRAALIVFAVAAVGSLGYAAATSSQSLPSGGDAAHAAHLGGLAIGILISAGLKWVRH